MTQEQQDKLRKALYNAKFTTDAEDKNPFVGVYFDDLLAIIEEYVERKIYHEGWLAGEANLAKEYKNIQWVNWIPVEEKRPPFDLKDDGTWSTSLPILIYSIHGISIGTFQLDHVSGKSYWFFDGSKHEEFSDGYRLITHWMPLPEAPRKEADND